MNWLACSGANTPLAAKPARATTALALVGVNASQHLPRSPADDSVHRDAGHQLENVFARYDNLSPRIQEEQIVERGIEEQSAHRRLVEAASLPVHHFQRLPFGWREEGNG
jgi:hypothetical protein